MQDSKVEKPKRKYVRKSNPKPVVESFMESVEKPVEPVVEKPKRKNTKK